MLKINLILKMKIWPMSDLGEEQTDGPAVWSEAGYLSSFHNASLTGVNKRLCPFVVYNNSFKKKQCTTPVACTWFCSAWRMMSLNLSLSLSLSLYMSVNNYILSGAWWLMWNCDRYHYELQKSRIKSMDLLLSLFNWVVSLSVLPSGHTRYNGWRGQSWCQSRGELMAELSFTVVLLSCWFTSCPTEEVEKWIVGLCQ